MQDDTNVCLKFRYVNLSYHFDYFRAFFFFLVDQNVRIFKISAGADISMAVSTTGQTYSWGVVKGGRIGLGMDNTTVNIPRQVHINDENGATLKAVDVDCGYVHSLIVGLNGTVHMCGGIGIDGANDGQVDEEDAKDSSNESGTCMYIEIFYAVVFCRSAPTEHFPKLMLTCLSMDDSRTPTDDPRLQHLA